MRNIFFLLILIMLIILLGYYPFGKEDCQGDHYWYGNFREAPNRDCYESMVNSGQDREPLRITPAEVAIAPGRTKEIGITIYNRFKRLGKGFYTVTIDRCAGPEEIHPTLDSKATTIPQEENITFNTFFTAPPDVDFGKYICKLTARRSNSSEGPFDEVLSTQFIFEVINHE